MKRYVLTWIVSSTGLLGCGGSGGDSASDVVANGLDQRPVNLTCIAPPRPTESTVVSSEDVFVQALGMRQPTKIMQAPGDGSRWYVLQQNGLLKTFNTATPGDIRVYLDLSDRVLFDGESGLLGAAFHPSFPAVPELYLFYTASGTQVSSRLSRFVLDDVGAPVSVEEQVLLTINKDSVVHNGGDIAFGSDGYLYVGVGDGSPGGDPAGNGQNTSNLLGAMLRIDVDGVSWPSPGYGIPQDNPFAGNPKCGPDGGDSDCPEIYAWGFRNPWRWSFDEVTGGLWVADVGQDRYEEINLVELGGNYGWPCREGFEVFNENAECGQDLVDPVAQYDHQQGDVSVTGGFVYRGAAIPGLQGRYVFGDAVSGRLFALAYDEGGASTVEVIADTPFSITTFGEDQEGELYVADNALTQRVHKIIPGGPQVPDLVASRLSETGCVSPRDVMQPADGLIPYEVNSELWSDGAGKVRHLSVPDGTFIGIEAETGHLEFPPGSVLMKSFWIAERPVETRLLMRHPDGVWAGYTYEWNDAGTDALRIQGGKTASIAGQAWTFPSEGQCLQCHTGAAGFSLGPKVNQLNRNMTYEATGRAANQLSTLSSIGILDFPVANPESLPSMADSSKSGQPLAERARAYLDANCSMCHRPGGPTPSSMDFRYETPLPQTNACDVLPGNGDLGIADARLIAPGSAHRSIAINRAGRRDVFRMPRIGSNEVDVAGVSLLSDWVNSLTACQ